MLDINSFTDFLRIYIYIYNEYACRDVKVTRISKTNDCGHYITGSQILIDL